MADCRAAQARSLPASGRSSVRNAARSSVWWWICGAVSGTGATCTVRSPMAWGAARLRGSSSNMAARAGSARHGRKPARKRRLRVSAGTRHVPPRTKPRTARPAPALPAPARIGGRPVGIDHLAPGQRRDPRAQVRVGRQDRESQCHAHRPCRVPGPVMLAHQPGQRGAILAPVVVTQAVGVVPRHPERPMIYAVMRWSIWSNRPICGG